DHGQVHERRLFRRRVPRPDPGDAGLRGGGLRGLLPGRSPRRPRRLERLANGCSGIRQNSGEAAPEFWRIPLHPAAQPHSRGYQGRGTQIMMTSLKAIARYGAAAAVCLIFVIWRLKLWRADLSVPFCYDGDSLLLQMW